MRPLVALVFLASPPLLAQSGSPAELGLAGAMARARGQARDVAAAEARSAAAEARAEEARGYRLPTVRLSESWVRTDSPAEAFALLLNQERFAFSDFVAGDPNDPDPLDTAISRVELELPIWTGGEISTRVEQARLAAEASRSEAGRAGDLAALAAADAWLDLVRAREGVALLERSRETVARHVELAASYAGQGMIVRSDLLRAEVELARIDDLLAEARHGAAVAEAQLALRLGEPLGEAYSPAALAAASAELGPLDSWLASADGRPDLAAARQKLAAGELEERAQRAARLPRVGLLARHDWTDDRLFGGHGSASTVMAGVTFDLFDGGRKRAAVASARAEAEAGRAEVALFADGVALEVRAAYAAALAALDRQATAGAALDAAAEALRIVDERFRSGVVKSLDVLDAATARREAEMRELVARTDAHAALLHLAVAAGRAPESVLIPGNDTPAAPAAPAGDPS